MRFIAVFAVILCAGPLGAQVRAGSGQRESSYTLQLPVDEVVLTFHAVDEHGLPVNDLKASEVRLLDNGAPPRRVVAFDSIVNRPFRAAILLDTSESMGQSLPTSKHIAQQFAERIFRQDSDQATVIDFAYASNTASQWTSKPGFLSQSIENVHLGAMNPMPGTAIFDTIFRTCAYGFEHADPAATGNFIVLFSDGEDNAGTTTAEEALRACQHSNTVIYAFRVASGDGENSTGPRTLKNLAANTGGRVFPADAAPDAIWNDLKTIEAEMRNQYRLVYDPANFRRDGAFRTIELQLPDRVRELDVRSGYYAARQ